MQIIETFPAPETKAGHLFWLPAYVRLAKEVYAGFLKTGETSEAMRFVGNCAARWGISKRCAEAILTGEATHEVGPEIVTITRTVREE
jgi:hypothetical protein